MKRRSVQDSKVAFNGADSASARERALFVFVDWKTANKTPPVMNCEHTWLSNEHLRYKTVCCHAVQETAFKITAQIYDNICVLLSVVVTEPNIESQNTVDLVRQFLTHGLLILSFFSNVLQYINHVYRVKLHQESCTTWGLRCVSALQTGNSERYPVREGAQPPVMQLQIVMTCSCNVRDSSSF